MAVSSTNRRGPVEVFTAADGHDVVISGRLDVHSVPDVRDAVHEVIDFGSGEVRLHMAGAEIGDTTGLGLIVHLYRRAARAERRLVLVDATDRTARLVRGCRLDRLLARGVGGTGAAGAAAASAAAAAAGRLGDTVSPLTA